jgi:hypothetical protein
MFDRKQFKLIAKEKMKANKLILKFWLATLFASFLMSVAKAIPGTIALSSWFIVSQQPIFAAVMATLLFLIIWVLTYPLWIGRQKYLLDTYNDVEGVRMTGDVYFLYKEDYFSTIFAVATTRIIIWLFSMLLIIPGIIAKYKYRYVEFILAEKPTLTGKQARKISQAMTEGHKKDLFIMDLSFILWNMLVSITGGLAGIYVAPYKATTNITAYKKLKKEYAIKKTMQPAPVVQETEYEEAVEEI